MTLKILIDNILQFIINTNMLMDLCSNIEVALEKES